MAFSARLLLVSDCGRDAVHVIDVDHGTHVGYVAAPGTILRPRGVATKGSLAAAIGARLCAYALEYAVYVFERSGDFTWTAARVIRCINGQGWWMPFGLRFCADGSELVVTDMTNKRLNIFWANEGWFLRHVVLSPHTPMDAEECGGGAGYIVCTGKGGLVAVVERDPGVVVKEIVGSALALAPVPGVGLVVRHVAGLQFLATPDAVAMAAMSSCKVAWMAAVWRARP